MFLVQHNHAYRYHIGREYIGRSSTAFCRRNTVHPVLSGEFRYLLKRMVVVHPRPRNCLARLPKGYWVNTRNIHRRCKILPLSLAKYCAITQNSAHYAECALQMNGHPVPDHGTANKCLKCEDLKEQHKEKLKKNKNVTLPKLGKVTRKKLLTLWS